MFIVGNLGPALALDRMGRRKTMLYGCFGLGICMMMASILLSFGKKNTSSAAVAFFFVYMIIVSHQSMVGSFLKISSHLVVFSSYIMSQHGTC